MLFKHDRVVSLRKEDHRYFDQYQREYLSNSKLFKSIIPQFDPTGEITERVAKKNGLTKEEQQQKWKKDNEVYTTRGTLIHDNLDIFFRTGANPDPEYTPLCHSIYGFFKTQDYKRHYSEQVLFFENVDIAGTEDLVFERRGLYEKNPIIDMFDYKTNKDGIVQMDKYKRYLNPPMSHLENCNYNEYALKMSSYALMAERTWGYKIGRLGIVYIPPLEPMSWHIIPVPYMRSDVIKIVNNHINDNAAISVQ